MYEQAETNYKIAIYYKKDYPTAYNNLGLLYKNHLSKF